MLKPLLKDSVVYAAANAVQKLGPFVVIPIVTGYLGQEAFKIYDVSFVSAYVVSWLVVLGQDVAASLLYFDKSQTAANQRQVVAYSLFLQVGFLLLLAFLFVPVSGLVSAAFFSNDASIANWWPKALLLLPGHLLYNHALNVMLWQKRKLAFVLLCVAQTGFSIVSVFVTIVLLRGNIGHLFYSLVGSITASGMVGLFLIRKEIFTPARPVNKTLLRRLLWLGVPFALTAFFQQLIPAVDRYFLLRYNHGNELALYALSAKLGTLVNFGTSAFVLAFTPYSLAKLNEPGAEEEMAKLFRLLSASAFLLVPFLLLFKDLLVGLFADASYGISARLLPFFFFGWVFDMFTYFTLLGIYRSQKTWLSLLLFVTGFALVSVLHLLLIPVWGLYGAAFGFCLGKALLFFIAWLWLKKYFPLRIHATVFVSSFCLAIACSYLIYILPLWASATMIALLLSAGFLFIGQKRPALVPGAKAVDAGVKD